MMQTPLPIVSGRYFFPNAPVLCLKRMPACAVTSTKSIGPEGLAVSSSRGEAFVAGLLGDEDEGAVDGALSVDEPWLVSSDDLCLQPIANNARGNSVAK